LVFDHNKVFIFQLTGSIWLWYGGLAGCCSKCE